MIRASEYEATFDATREALTDAGFELERVDARAGVISSQPFVSAGIAAPWRQPAMGMYQMWQDALSTHQRRVRVTFVPISDKYDAQGAPDASRQIGSDDAERTPTAAPPIAPQDRREQQQDLVVRVDAVVERVYRPGTRVDTTSMRLRSNVEDPALRERVMYPTYAVAVERDESLSAFVLKAILRRARDIDAASP